MRYFYSYLIIILSSPLSLGAVGHSSMQHHRIVDNALTSPTKETRSLARQQRKNLKKEVHSIKRKLKKEASGKTGKFIPTALKSVLLFGTIALAVANPVLFLIIVGGLIFVSAIIFLILLATTDCLE